MSFNYITFKEKVTADNGHFEWFKTSTLHTLIALLKQYPSKTRPDQVAAELSRIPQDKQTKYKNALDYVRAEIPVQNFGVTQTGLRTAKGAQHHVVPNAIAPPVRRTDITGKLDPSIKTGGGVAAKAEAFDKATRRNVVLSGHGCWAQNGDDTWPYVDLKNGQEIHYYCAHYIPLMNDVGQRIDNHQQVAPEEVIKGPARIFNYTLQPKGTLTLLNRMQGQGGHQLDGRFITVDANTLLDSFINDTANKTAVFHWAACRVVFNNLGQKWSPTANRWMDWDYTTRAWV